MQNVCVLEVLLSNLGVKLWKPSRQTKNVSDNVSPTKCNNSSLKNRSWLETGVPTPAPMTVDGPRVGPWQDVLAFMDRHSDSDTRSAGTGGAHGAVGVVTGSSGAVVTRASFNRDRYIYHSDYVPYKPA